MSADGEINQKNMEKRILTIIQERMEQMENDYLLSVLLLKAYAPDRPLPSYSPKSVKEFVDISLLPVRNTGKSGGPQKKYMTIKEAMSVLKVSRTTINRLRKEGALTSYYRKRNVILLASEIHHLVETYSKIRGKI